MTQFKYQEQFAKRLAGDWVDGKRAHVRTTIHSLKNKAQAAYIAAHVAWELTRYTEGDAAHEFIQFMHPNNS